MKNNVEKMSYEEILLKHKPDFCFGISFVPYGYQLDIYKNGKLLESGCGDFAKNYKVEKLINEFSEKFDKLMKDFNKGK